MNTLNSTIGENMDIQNLISKNISVGKRTFEHPNFLKNLKDSSYFKN